MAVYSEKKSLKFMERAVRAHVKKLCYEYVIGYGVTVNITASHAVARGSIPRIRMQKKRKKYFLNLKIRKIVIFFCFSTRSPSLIYM